MVITLRPQEKRKPAKRMVVFYIRVSSNLQDVENSRDGQIRALQEYADAHGCIVVGIYIDEAVSGKKDDRPALNRLLRDAKGKDCQFNEVLVWRFNRFGRKASTIDRKATELEERGVVLTSIKEPLSGGQANVRFMRNTFGNLSELQSDTMGEDIARGIRESVLTGVWSGRVPFGYDKDYRLERGKMRPHLKVNPEQAKTIRRMANLFSGGTVQRKIANTFNKEKVPGPTDSPWIVNRVSKLLKNPLYSGFIKVGEKSKHGYDVIMIPAPELEIISLEQYGKMQEIFAKRATGNRHPREIASTHPLSGLTLCEPCEAKMSPVGGGKKRNDMPRYTCRHKTSGISPECTTPNIRKDDLEPAVLDHLLSRTLTGENLDEVISTVTEEYKGSAGQAQEELGELNSKIDAQKQERRNLLAKVRHGEVEDTDISEEMTEIRDTLKTLERARMEAQAKSENEQALVTAPERVKEYAEHLSTYLRDSNSGLLKEILALVVKEIWVKKGPEERSAIIRIVYRIPMPPDEWGEQMEGEEGLRRAESRSLIPIAQGGGLGWG